MIDAVAVVMVVMDEMIHIATEATIDLATRIVVIEVSVRNEDMTAVIAKAVVAVVAVVADTVVAEKSAVVMIVVTAEKIDVNVMRVMDALIAMPAVVRLAAVRSENDMHLEEEMSDVPLATSAIATIALTAKVPALVTRLLLVLLSQQLDLTPARHMEVRLEHQTATTRHIQPAAANASFRE